MKNTLKIGDRAVYRHRLQGARTGTIIGMGIEITGTVFDIKLDDGGMRWGYEHQFQPEAEYLQDIADQTSLSQRQG